VKTRDVVRAWGRILSGRAPSLSIEITRECPLSCPGCYAYNDEHLGTGVTLREVRDFKGQQLVDGVLALVEEHKPLHLSIVGGDPMVRLFELEELLPKLTARGIHCQIVTSAFRKIPAEWTANPHISVSVSIDGLQPEHDERRKPATYERILRNIEGCTITVHCTVTRQMLARDGYLEEFMEFWSARPEVEKVWMSLYTPQRGEISSERLTSTDRKRVAAELVSLRMRFPKLDMAESLIESYVEPPRSPEDCVFAQTTATISADLTTKITPCQFGGDPDCSQCGCIASAGLHAIAQHRLPIGIQVGTLFRASLKIGAARSRLRKRSAAPLIGHSQVRLEGEG
jgi:MoaA/NifB/PqqE/SkfB family radical SAM enzyme